MASLNINGEPSSSSEWLEQIRIIEALLSTLSTQLDAHLNLSHPHTGGRYNVTLQPILLDTPDPRYRSHWHCPTCRYIHRQAKVFNVELDKAQYEYYGNHTFRPIAVPRRNTAMTDIYHYPFPDMEPAVIIQVLRAHANRSSSPPVERVHTPGSDDTDPVGNGHDVRPSLRFIRNFVD
jgi:hypothetical protein